MTVWRQGRGGGRECRVTEVVRKAMMARSFGLRHSHVFAGQSLKENGHVSFYPKQNIVRVSHGNFQDANYFGPLPVNRDSHFCL